MNYVGSFSFNITTSSRIGDGTQILIDFIFFTVHCTEVRFASFLSGGFITAIVVNPLESKQAKRTSVHCSD